VARLEDRARELGAKIGLTSLQEVRAAVRRSTSALDPEVALGLAQDAVRRAEARAGEIMPQPLPDPCAVTPMPQTVAESGMAPHYTRPRKDGSRPGTYWFNTQRPTAGTGWDLEAVAFHETVPGHHSQLARLQRLTELPLLQQLSITVHAEGWGLYAERLAGEFGLYSGVEAEIGSVYVEMHRAAGRRHRPARPRVEPAAGPRLPARARRAGRGVPDRRDRPLHRLARAGAGLPRRAAGDPPAARAGPDGAGRPVRPAVLQRGGARLGQPADARAGGRGGALDRRAVTRMRRPR
jgi:hypothetical protein